MTRPRSVGRGAPQEIPAVLLAKLAIDDRAARFSRQHDFRPLPGNERRLLLTLSTVAEALGKRWP